jgi:hypothetical protein
MEQALALTHLADGVGQHWMNTSRSEEFQRCDNLFDFLKGVADG